MTRNIIKFEYVTRITSRVILIAAFFLLPIATLLPSASPPAAAASYMHTTAMALLAFLCCMSFENNLARFWSVVLIFLYSAFMELLQHFSAHRHGSWEDVLSNALGCLAGVLLYFSATLLIRKARNIFNNI